jgi:hypothetical protein
MNTATVPACAISPFSWDKVQPCHDSDGSQIPCYSRELKAELLPGTFVLLVPTSPTAKESRNNVNGMIVARIVDVVETTIIPALSRTRTVQENIFKRLSELSVTEGFLRPKALDENHLRHLPEVVQTTEIRSISSNEMINLAFVFTMASLQDAHNLFFTSQGMAIVFVVRYRSEVVQNNQPMLIDVPGDCCLPFPSSYPN